MKSIFSFNDDKTEFKADYGQLLIYFKENPKNKIAETFHINGSKIMYDCLNDDVGFKGGRFEEIFNDVVIDTKQELDAKPQQNFVNKRKRYLSEHDGDYVHERRHDINFMESARREKVQGNNLIKINACANFSAGVSASTINAYAKEICEVVNYFESIGRSVELNLTYRLKNSFYNAPLIKTFITVKRPDKYLSKADIYRAFSSMFFRYIGFCTIVLGAEINGKSVTESLGCPDTEDNRITITDDSITIHGMTTAMMDKIKGKINKSA